MNVNCKSTKCKKFILCADDYAMTPSVSRGILRLIEAGRLSATGSMTNLKSWENAAKDLIPFIGKVDLGLHLNLTCGAPLIGETNFLLREKFPSMKFWLASAFVRNIPLSIIEKEIQAQLDAFENALGMIPDFIDGHQHIHAIPKVRDAFINVISRRYTQKKPYIRSVSDNMFAIIKRRYSIAKALIVASFAAKFDAQIRAIGFPLTQGFSGYSNFSFHNDYKNIFPHYLKNLGEKHLIMCHPGYVDNELLAIDPATYSREQELAFFLSDEFIDICEKNNCAHASFKDIE